MTSLSCWGVVTGLLVWSPFKHCSNECFWYKYPNVHFINIHVTYFWIQNWWFKGMAILMSTDVEFIPREPYQFPLRLTVWECQLHPHCVPADFLISTHELLGQTSSPSCKASLLCRMPQQVSACPRCPVTDKQKAQLVCQGKQTADTDYRTVLVFIPHVSVGGTWEPGKAPARAAFLTRRSGTGQPRSSLVYYVIFRSHHPILYHLSIAGLL